MLLDEVEEALGRIEFVVARNVLLENTLGCAHIVVMNCIGRHIVFHRAIAHTHGGVGIRIEALARLGGGVEFTQTLHENMVVLLDGSLSFGVFHSVVDEDLTQLAGHHEGIVFFHLLGAGLLEEIVDAFRSSKIRVLVDVSGKSVNVAIKLLVDDLVVELGKFFLIEGLAIEFQHLGKGLLFHLWIGVGKEFINIHGAELLQHGVGFLVVLVLGSLVIRRESEGEASRTGLCREVGIVDVLGGTTHLFVSSHQVREGFAVFSLTSGIFADPFLVTILQANLGFADFVLAKHLALADEVFPSVGEAGMRVGIHQIDGIVGFLEFFHHFEFLAEDVDDDGIEGLDVVVDAEA